MSALKNNFDYRVNQYSPVIGEKQRIVNYDAKGNEFVTYEDVDLQAIQKSLGSVKDWSLDSLLKAGVSPEFPIHTSYGTRLEGLKSVEDFSRVADEILSEINNENNNKE